MKLRFYGYIKTLNESHITLKIKHINGLWKVKDWLLCNFNFEVKATIAELAQLDFSFLSAKALNFALVG